MSMTPISAAAGHQPRPLLGRIARLVGLGLATRRHRHALGRLDAHLLRDIGLTAEEARAEATRPIWDVPTHWRG